jgi:hypothetical protein
MKKETTGAEVIVGLIATTIFMGLIAAYAIVVIKDTCRWYDLSNPFTTKQMFGLIWIKVILLYGTVKESKEYSTMAERVLIPAFTSAFVLSLLWLIIYLIHFFI